MIDVQVTEKHLIEEIVWNLLRGETLVASGADVEQELVAVADNTVIIGLLINTSEIFIIIQKV